MFVAVLELTLVQRNWARPAFPKLWVATQKWVAKFCLVGLQRFSGNIYFLSFICKMHKNTVYLLPLFSEFSIELQSSSKFRQHVVMSHPPFVNCTDFPYKPTSMSKCASQWSESIQTHLPPMFPHLLHIVHLSNPDELYEPFISSWFCWTQSLRKFGNHAFALAAPISIENKLPDFICKSASLSLCKLTSRHSLFKIYYD